MERRRIEPSTRARMVMSACAGLWWLGFALQAVTGAAPRGWWLAVDLLVGALLVLAGVQLWRTHVVVDDDGVVLDSGLGSVRRVAWSQVEGLRPPGLLRPAVLEVHDDADVRFGRPGTPPLSRGQARELAEAIRAQS